MTVKRARAPRKPAVAPATDPQESDASEPVDTRTQEDYSQTNPQAQSTKEGTKIMSAPLEIETVDASAVPQTRRGPGSNPYFDYVQANYVLNQDVQSAKDRKWSAFTITDTDSKAVKTAFSRLRSAGGRVVTGDTNGKGDDKGAGLQLSSEEVTDESGNVTGYKIYFVASKRRFRSPNGTNKQNKPE